jgi:type IV pilus assembly protein PilM
MASGVGVDMGAQAVKVVELRVSEKGAVVRRALYLDRAALGARTGGKEGAAPGAAAETSSDRPQLLAALKREMTAAGIPTKEVSLGISGKDSIIRYTHVPPVPAWRLKIILDYEVGEVAEKIGEKLSSDYRILPVTREDDEDQAIIIGLAKEPTLDGLLGDLEKAGITVAKAIPAPLCLYSAYAAFGKKPDLESPEDELVVVVDLGAESVNIAFLLNGNLAFARSAGFGGKSFTEAIARDLGIELERAESIKLRGGTLEPGGGGRTEETVNPLRGAAAQLLSMIQSSLKFSRSQTGVKLPDPSRYVVLGGGMALPGLPAYLQNGLGKPVEVFHPQLAQGPGISEAAQKVLASSPGSFSVALGLAAAGMKREGMELSLLPSLYLKRRLFRDRTLFLYLAASFLLIFLAARLVEGFTELSTAQGRKKTLDSAQIKLKAEKATMLSQSEENGRTRARINRILREAEVVPFQTFVLDFLARKVGSELKINGCKLVLGEEPESGEPLYQLHLDGAADNASQKALERIEGLRTAVSAEARVEKVEVLSTRPSGNWYEFQMLLTPGFQTQK